MLPLEILWFLTLPLGVFAALALSGSGTPRRPGALTAAALVLVMGAAGDVVLLREQLDLRSWQPTLARVVRSEKGEGRSQWRFEYEYESDGALHRSGAYTKSARFRSRQDTDALIAEYPVGREITVHVDPQNPDHAVVDSEPRYALPIAAFSLHAWLATALSRSAAASRRA